MSAIDQEKKIAEIREALERAKGKYTVGTIADSWCRFLLSELERLGREHAEERAAHNAHVAELIEKEAKLNQALEALERIAVVDVFDWSDETFQGCVNIARQAIQQIKGGAM